MVDAAKDATATVARIPAPDGPSTDAPIDADTISAACNQVLWATRPLTEAQRDQCGGLLLGAVQLLLPELAAVAALMGTWRPMAEHVLQRARQILTENASAAWPDLEGLATYCRALLLTFQQYTASGSTAPPGTGRRL